MKKLSKIVSVVLSLALCLGMASPAFAASFSQLQEAIDDTGNSKGTAILDDNDQETGRYGYAHNAETNKYDIEAWTSDDGTRSIQLNENVNRTPEDGSFDKSSGINIGTVHKQTQCGGLDGVKDTDFSVTEHTNVVSIDLNGHDINGACSKSTSTGGLQWGSVPFDSVIRVGEDGDLTVTDSTAHFEEVKSEETGETIQEYISGKITGGNGKNQGDLNDNYSFGWSHGGGVYIEEKGKFTLNDGTIAGNSMPTCGGGVYVDKDAAFEMNGGQISGNKGDFGGGVCNNGSFKMTGGTIKDNTAKYSGGGVASFEEADLDIGGTADIYGNTTTEPNYDKFPASRFPGFTGYGDGDSHEWGDYVVIEEATTEQDGLESRYCPHCGKTETRVIPRLELPAQPETPEVPEVPAVPGEVALPDNDVPLAGGGDTATITDQEVPLAGLVSRGILVSYLYAHEGSPDGEDAEGEYTKALAWAVANDIIDEEADSEEAVTVAILRDVMARYAQLLDTTFDVEVEGEDDELVMNCGEILAKFFKTLEQKAA